MAEELTFQDVARANELFSLLCCGVDKESVVEALSMMHPALVAGMHCRVDSSGHGPEFDAKLAPAEAALPPAILALDFSHWASLDTDAFGAPRGLRRDRVYFLSSVVASVEVFHQRSSGLGSAIGGGKGLRLMAFGEEGKARKLVFVEARLSALAAPKARALARPNEYGTEVTVHFGLDSLVAGARALAAWLDW